MTSQLCFLRREVVQRLYDNVESNLDAYKSGDFNDIIKDTDLRKAKSAQYDPDPLEDLVPERGGEKDVENAILVHQSLGGISPYLARDERVWTYLTHVVCLRYVRLRWLELDLTDDKIVKGIRLHFFARGSRAFERNNAISCLWWWAHIASRYDKIDLRQALEILLHQTDVRASIVERPTLARSKKVFSAIMGVLCKYYDDDRTFFSRSKKSGNYRVWLKRLNRHGGVRLLDALETSSLEALVWELSHES